MLSTSVHKNPNSREPFSIVKGFYVSETPDTVLIKLIIDLKNKDVLLKILHKEFKSYDKWKFRKIVFKEGILPIMI